MSSGVYLFNEPLQHYWEAQKEGQGTAGAQSDLPGEIERDDSIVAGKKEAERVLKSASSEA